MLNTALKSNNTKIAQFPETTNNNRSFTHSALLHSFLRAQTSPLNHGCFLDFSFLTFRGVISFKISLHEVLKLSTKSSTSEYCIVLHIVYTKIFIALKSSYHSRRLIYGSTQLWTPFVCGREPEMCICKMLQ